MQVILSISKMIFFIFIFFSLKLCFNVQDILNSFFFFSLDKEHGSCRKRVFFLLRSIAIILQVG